MSDDPRIAIRSTIEYVAPLWNSEYRELRLSHNVSTELHLIRQDGQRWTVRLSSASLQALADAARELEAAHRDSSS